MCDDAERIAAIQREAVSEARTHGFVLGAMTAGRVVYDAALATPDLFERNRLFDLATRLFELRPEGKP